MYLGDKGITDRSTVIIDASGIVRYANSAGPGGKRDINELLAKAQAVDAAYDGATTTTAAPGFGADTTLYVKSDCGFSASVLSALENLGAQGLTIRNVSDDAAALADLQKAAGKSTVPCLVSGGTAMHEAKDIVRQLATLATGI